MMQNGKIEEWEKTDIPPKYNNTWPSFKIMPIQKFGQEIHTLF
jgi:hypothetical protein